MDPLEALWLLDPEHEEIVCPIGTLLQLIAEEADEAAATAREISA
jgi:hypothetical protein